ncbi:MAG TPA: hypothetical protein VK633_00180 [Verrucomicrobiae bacterium]|nr:hypothetical protein [Verrucomicrobiae bacterium]
MRRLLTRSVLQELVKNEPARFDLGSAEQCYFYVWRMFRCDICGREEKYDEASRKGGIGQAAEKAKEEGWYVPPIAPGGNLDCSAYCAKCAPAEKRNAQEAAASAQTAGESMQIPRVSAEGSPPH